MTQKFQLKNGLDVLLIPNTKSPVVSVQMWVRTGSADERKSEEGISHFIEHLVFKGSREFKTGEIAQVVEGSGGQLNAYTSFDQTVFYVTISSQFKDTALKVIREMMGFPIFDPTEIDNEREVVIEEIKRGEDSPSRRASQALFSTAYKKHAYRIPVIGYGENIKNFSSQKIKKFYDDRYSTKNMTLVIAGDFDPKTVTTQIKENFEQLRRTPLRKVRRIKEPLQKSPRYHVEKTDFKMSQFYLAWPGVSATDKDAVILDILMLCLGQGESSRLVHQIRNQKGLVQSIGGFSYSPSDRGLLALSANLNHSKLEEVLGEMNLVLEDMLAKGFTQEEIAKAARALETERYYSFETVDGMTQTMGGLFFYFKDLKAFDRILKSIDKVTGQDLLRVARKYLRPERMTLVYLAEEANAAAEGLLRSFQKQYAKTFALTGRARFKKNPAPRRLKIRWGVGKGGSRRERPQRVVLSTGARLLFLKSKDSPVVSVKSAFLGGLLSEPERHAGLNELFSRVWVSNTARTTEEELNRKIDGLASSLSAFAGRNSTGLNMTTLNSFAEPMAAFFSEVYREPLFSSDVLEREKSVMLEQLRNRDDNPSRICIMKMMEELFGRHPYHRDPLGHHESVSALSREQILEHYKRIVIPKNMSFAVVGDTEIQVWQKYFEALTGDIGKADQSQKVQWPPVEDFKLSSSRTAFQKLDKEQSHLALAYPGRTIGSKDRPTLDILQAILSGQGGRLFIELRDKESLAYSVSPIRMDGLKAGYFGGYIGCSPDKVEKALGMMRVEFEKLAKHKVPAEELERSKRQIIGRHDIGLQKNSSLAGEMVMNDVYGLPFDEYLSISESYMCVTAEMVQKLAQDLFSQPSVVSLVGPKSLD
jgi:zinc protease